MRCLLVCAAAPLYPLAREGGSAACMTREARTWSIVTPWIDAGFLEYPAFGSIRRKRRQHVVEETRHMDKVLGILSVGLVTLSALLLAAGPVAAQEGTLKKIKETNTITLGHRDASIPFSYFDDKQQAVGYAMDLCGKIVDAVKAELKMPNLQVQLSPCTSATRIPLMANGTVDLECGSTTNNLERQKQVAFTITHFVTANRFVSKKAANLKTLDDLKGKTIVSTSGTTNIKQITEIGAQKGLNLNILAAKDHAEAFLMVETGRAAAFVMDDILLYSLVAGSKSPKDYEISADALSVEPYGIMLRRDDAPFKKV